MCRACKTKPVYEFFNKRKLCARCFVKWFQKKFLFTIRKFHMIKKDQVVGYENKGDFRGVVLEDCLKIYSNKGIIEIIKLPTKKKVDKIAVTDSTSTVSDSIINELIYGRDLKKFNPVQGKTIKPLYLFLDKEILLYAKIKKLKFKKPKQKKNKLDKFIDNMEEKHPELKHSVIKSYLDLN